MDAPPWTQDGSSDDADDSDVFYVARLEAGEDTVDAEDVSRASCRLCDGGAAVYARMHEVDDEESGAFLCATCASLVLLRDTGALVARTDWEDESDAAPGIVDAIVRRTTTILTPVDPDGRRPGRDDRSGEPEPPAPEGGWVRAWVEWTAAGHLTDLRHDSGSGTLRVTFFDGLPFDREVVVSVDEDTLAGYLQREAGHRAWRGLNLEPLDPDLRREALAELGEELVMMLEEVTESLGAGRRTIWRWHLGPRGLGPD